MARWRLKSAHYLMIPGGEWEYKETSQETGKQVRRVFPVPTYLHPDDPGDHNYPGEIIVTNGGTRQPRDLEFSGPPTPEMDPLDDEAKAQSAEQEKRYKVPFDTFNVSDYNQSLLDGFQRQIAELAVGAATTPVNTPVKGVDPNDFAKLQEQVAALMARNAELEATLTKRRG